MPTALITGITGQDGSYLAEFLLSKGYKVYGIVRRASTFNRKRIDHLRNNTDFELIYGDLSDSHSLYRCLRKTQPDELYNLAAQSHVGISFDIPDYTSNITGLGTVRLLDAIRLFQEETGQIVKFYQASSSELYGKIMDSPQSEKTPFYPRSPYGAAKLYAYWVTRIYRESYQLFACNGILFNHESPRRGKNFVTRKISHEVARIKLGISSSFSLGNLDAKRDWGHAQDYIEAMWLMLQQEKPDDYVIATGETHSVREFVEEAFRVADIPVESNNKKGVEEVYLRTDTKEVVLNIDEKQFRPNEVQYLSGDSKKAMEELSWKPNIYFKDLVKEMVNYDIDQLKNTTVKEDE
jgi:GDPmannose 4,6-dehydratase